MTVAQLKELLLVCGVPISYYPNWYNSNLPLNSISVATFILSASATTLTHVSLKHALPLAIHLFHLQFASFIKLSESIT